MHLTSTVACDFELVGSSLASLMQYLHIHTVPLPRNSALEGVRRREPSWKKKVGNKKKTSQIIDFKSLF